MKKVKIGLLGFGTVGSGVWKIINDNKDIISQKCGSEIVISKILVRDIKKKRNADIPDGILTTDADDILNDKDIKIIVEVMGGIEPARNCILRAFKCGKHVVTANKALLARDGKKLLDAAYKYDVQLKFEASVAGGIPVINALQVGLSANRINEITGIVNGTTNYILTKMANHEGSYEEVLKEAQKMGYAEADPTADIEGIDAANKLAILSSLAFETYVDVNDVYREGISKITGDDIAFAEEHGYTIKLLAIARHVENVLELRVHPAMIKAENPLSSVNDTYNAVYINGNAVGSLMLYGRGAGDLPTGSAVVSDILSVIKSRGEAAFTKLSIKDEKIDVMPMDKITCGYYIRFIAKNKAGMFGAISAVFGEYGVNLNTVSGYEMDDENAFMVFIVNDAIEGDIQKSIKKVLNLPGVVKLASLIRIENNI